MTLAPTSTSGAFHVSTTIIVIVVAVAIAGILAIMGFKAPDRSPGEETKAQRERIED